VSQIEKWVLASVCLTHVDAHVMDHNLAKWQQRWGRSKSYKKISALQMFYKDGHAFHTFHTFLTHIASSLWPQNSTGWTFKPHIIVHASRFEWPPALLLWRKLNIFRRFMSLLIKIIFAHIKSIVSSPPAVRKDNLTQYNSTFIWKRN